MSPARKPAHFSLKLPAVGWCRTFEMTSPDSATPNGATESGSDSELADLPTPRRPWRRTTLFVLAVGAVGSMWLALSVLPDVVYTLRGGEPVGLGELGTKTLDPKLANRWVQGAGELSVTRAIRYERPLERDTYRLAALTGNARLWVQVRVPANEEGPRFVPPASFVGRLLPVSDLGLRQKGLREAVEAAGLEPPRDDAWLLVDGESPQGMRWVMGLFVLLVAFAAFNVLGLVRLGRPIAAGPEQGP
jgi:hypothetical protein